MRMPLRRNRTFKYYLRAGRLPWPLYDALPTVYACLGVGLLYLLDSDIAFVLGIGLLVAAALVTYMRSSARHKRLRKLIKRRRSRY
jgi:O-antigen/teichoic acid export membrane protein